LCTKGGGERCGSKYGKYLAAVQHSARFSLPWSPIETTMLDIKIGATTINVVVLVSTVSPKIAFVDTATGSFSLSNRYTCAIATLPQGRMIVS